MDYYQEYILAFEKSLWSVLKKKNLIKINGVLFIHAYIIVQNNAA